MFKKFYSPLLPPMPATMPPGWPLTWLSDTTPTSGFSMCSASPPGGYSQVVVDVTTGEEVTLDDNYRDLVKEEIRPIMNARSKNQKMVH
ncbi:MAG: hypothetical protein R2875_15370 [Desulfobacterales bacterium]